MSASRAVRAGRLTFGLLVAIATLAPAQQRITSPRDHFGFNLGDDYRLATYTQLEAYWKRVDGESDRVVVQSIGKTAEGRDQLMAIITAPANHARLAEYRDIAARLARAEGLTDEQARDLARRGKAVVWIDGGLHATEVLGATQLTEHVWQMASRTDPETMRLLEDVIQLVVHANPDGMELVSNWYMRNPNETQRSTGGIPRLYQKYIGHDNNRDFYLNAMPESENMSRVMYREWHPQIMYNHHQTGPAGTVMFAPPFRDPHNHNLDPLLINQLSLVGIAMHTRFAAENKPGVTMRGGASYQTWWNGGLRTAAYFHNIVGILTETIGNPTPISIPLIPDRQLSTGDLPFPIAPQRWHFRQSVDYSITANRAILDLASKYREDWLYNRYQMGRNAIRNGSQDTWTIYPRRIERLKAEMARARATQPVANPGGFGGGGGGAGAAPIEMLSVLRDPADRDPRGYILPADQPDFMTATRFVNALLKSGVDVHRATAAFSAGNKRYPAGSYVVRSAQAFRAHVLDMFEPQDYPNDFAYPGGPPRAPYDNAGYTLALQMGVKFDRMLDSFDGPFQKIEGLVTGAIAAGATVPAGASWTINPSQNDAFVAVNRLLAARQAVRRLPDGRFHVSGSGARAILQALATERGLRVEAGGPAGGTPLRTVRVGLWDVYGGSMPSGWVRWLLEQFEFPFEVVFAPTLDAGNLNAKYDVLVFVDGAIPAAGGGGGGFGGGGGNVNAASIPEEFRGQLGRVTAAQTVPKLKEFLEAGGTVVTIGGSTSLAQHLGLPIGDHMTERTPEGAIRPLPSDRFYSPTSVLEVAVDPTAPVAAGMEARAMVTFDNSPVFSISPGALAAGIRPVAWFDSATPLRSGWAWGQTYLEGGVVAAEARVGRGTLYLFGPEITFRAQPHGTFRFLFNGILKGAESR